MGYSQFIARGALAWLAGEEFPAPPARTFLALHGHGMNASGSQELTERLFGDGALRYPLPSGFWGPVEEPPPIDTQWWGASVTATSWVFNTVEAILPVVTSQGPVDARFIGIWDEATDGHLLYRGDLVTADGPGRIVVRPQNIISFAARRLRLSLA